MALEIKNRLAASLNVMLHATVIFDYPTVNQLATYLLDTYFADIDPVLSSRVQTIKPKGLTNQMRSHGVSEARIEHTATQAVEQLSGTELLNLIDQLGKGI